MKRDVPATEAAGFADKRSYICWDGREVLAGADWKARKRELWKRCQGECEKWTCQFVPILEGVEVPGARKCRKEAVHPHHKIKKSVKHDDRLENLMGICEEHHRMMHPEKQTRFGEGRGESAGT